MQAFKKQNGIILCILVYSLFLFFNKYLSKSLHIDLPHSSLIRTYTVVCLYYVIYPVSHWYIWFLKNIYLAASGLSCGTQDLLLWRAGSSLWHAGLSLVERQHTGSVVTACGLSNCDRQV